MWKKIKDLKYPILIKYYVLGIIIAVPIFQFVVYSLRKHHLDFNALISNQTYICYPFKKQTLTFFIKTN